MLVANKGALLLKQADNDLLDILSRLESPSPRYASKVRLVQAECGRMAKDYHYCEQVCQELLASSDTRERFEGLLVKGKTLSDLGLLEKALATLHQAKAMELRMPGSCLGCELADVLIRMDRSEEALETLQSLAKAGGLVDPEHIERAYLLIGRAHLKRGDHNEALRYLSKSLAITRSQDKRPWYSALAEAYALAGMSDKAKEYEAKANPPKRWGEA
jgi:tetratricopeptide (TPR) repeat protein